MGEKIILLKVPQYCHIRKGGWLQWDWGHWKVKWEVVTPDDEEYPWLAAWEVEGEVVL